MVVGSHYRIRLLLSLCVTALLAVGALIQFPKASAQTAAPILISHEDSTRAISFESVTQQREPFAANGPVKFGSDTQTRIMLFAMNLSLQNGDTVSAISVEAED